MMCMDEPMVITIQTMNKLLSAPHPSICTMLYMFYYYTAKWQKTQTPKATVSYCVRGTGMGEHTIRKARKELSNLGLIRDIKLKGHGKYIGAYVQVVFAKTPRPYNSPQAENREGEAKTPRPYNSPQAENREGNACELLKRNAYELVESVQPGPCGLEPAKPSNTGKAPKKKSSAQRKRVNSPDEEFNLFWQAYPRKQGRKVAAKAWTKAGADLPPIPEILAALEVQRRSAQWQDPQFIPMAATWINQYRWEDESAPEQTKHEYTPRANNEQMQHR